MIEAYLIHILILICIYIVLAVSLDLTVGFAGMLNMGHVAFFGIGAYTSALLTLGGTPFLPALIAGAIMAGIAGFVLSLPTTKLKGDYLAVATLGFAFIIESVLKNWVSLTRGPLGLPGIPRPEFFGITVSSQLGYLIFSAVVMAICVFLIVRVEKSPFGRMLEATRDDEVAASTLGKDVYKTKAIALTVSAFFAGIAGSLYAHYISFIDPTTFSLLEVILLFSIIIVGGLGSSKGAIVGAIILLILPEPLRFLGFPSSIVGPARQILYALILLLILYFRPKGIFGRVELGES
ncbi:MAG: branched-chain amino acid ABC transporter permease [Nanoarchaeota archaeon]|nr:branched-chain amino acid ABC transporter permease [Nanoarchaeota archaeon]MBU1321045.1 branched-chain amino acid ABC transporter permease [Nanoarchaeota archaeon]MBU1598114.1 branched-chain amino acid ABC transporter permease [Nanoarchaeota archaeon]MBU2442322.1 branched-chain amino acid ABC transporter permease [Nanoarchaeota archaeon]